VWRKECIRTQLGTYEQMMLEYNYRYSALLDKNSFGRQQGMYKDFYSMLYCCGILQSSNNV
jgi:hypothetical protein